MPELKVAMCLPHHTQNQPGRCRDIDMLTSTSEILTLRGRRYHVRSWGPKEAPRLYLLHGWMDVSASFQFLADAFAREWRLIAPDWRGFGQSQWDEAPYWFPNYLADIDSLLEHFSPEQPVRIVGHSMGGNAASQYAGVRPERVERLVSLEGFGLMKWAYRGDAPQRYAKWLTDLRQMPSNKRYASHAEFAARLRRLNPRLSQDKADFLALHLSVERDGAIETAADPYHRLPFPILSSHDDLKACWREVTAPVLWVAGANSIYTEKLSGAEGQADFRERIACFADIRVETVADASHNLHHDQPQAVARLIEDFMP